MPTPQQTHQQVITMKMQLNEQIIKPIAIKPILSPVPINNTISIKQPILPNSSTPNKSIPIIIPNLINLPPPKTTIPKPNSETQDLILVKQPILPNSSTPPTITPTDNTLLYFIIGAVVVGFVILKNKDIV